MKKFKVLSLVGLLMMCTATSVSAITLTKINNHTSKKSSADSIADTYFKDIEDNISSYTREGLYNALHKKINDGWTKISYSSLNSHILKVDWENDDSNLTDIYSDKNCIKKTDTGNYSQEGDVWNKEHMIPKSWWGGSDNGPQGEGGDMFNMMAVDGWVNGMRSNFPYGEVGSLIKESHNGFSKKGTSSFPGYTGTIFEVNDQYKPLAAHSYFYFAVKNDVMNSTYTYTNKEGAVMFDKTGTFGLTDYATNLFLKWNKSASSISYEKIRAERVYKEQNNLNPFIFHPEWADFIWGDIPIVEGPSIRMKNNISLNIGESTNVNAEIIRGSGEISYLSSDDSIVSVDTSGTIKGLKKGNATITASSIVDGKQISSTSRVIIGPSIDTAQKLVDYLMESDTEGQCVIKYDVAKVGYINLSDTEKNIFKTSTDDKFVNARKRYEAWAKHQKDTNPYGDTALNQSSVTLHAQNEHIVTLIVASVLAGILSFVVVFSSLKKKKIKE